MEAEGGDGGCLAETLHTWVDNPPSLKIQTATKVDEPRNNDGAPVTEYEQKWHTSDIISTLHAFKYLKSVPTGRARKETWQMICEKSSACAQFVTTYFNLVWSNMYVPDGWQTSEAVQLDKQNGKKGTKSIRLINKLCPLGKAFFTLILQETTETPYYFGYGFYKNRRREQAILVHHAVTGRIRTHVLDLNQREKTKWSFITTLRDITNAFPSLSHESMDDTLKLKKVDDTVVQRKPKLLLKHRYTHMNVSIATKQGEGILMRPKGGGAQGDTSMPVIFRRTYEPVLEKWIHLKKETLPSITGEDPVTQKLLDVAVTVYADDVKEINMASTAVEAIANINSSTAILNMNLVDLTLKQNNGKAEHVPSFLGKGQDKLTKQFTAAVAELKIGASKSVARYLGNFCTYDNHNKTIVETRTYKAKEAFYSLGRLWKTNISRSIRCMTYKGYVTNALLTGLECETLRPCDIQKLELCQSFLMRRALNGIGNKMVDEVMHQTNNEEARKLMRIYTVHSTLRSRRLKWIQNIIAHPTENEQLRAAVCGKLTTRAGTITQPYVQWLRMIHEDTITLLEEGIRQSKQGENSWLYPTRQEILEWPDKDMLGKLLMPEHMTWIRGVATDLVLRTYEELHITVAKNDNETHHCNLNDKDGNACSFEGTQVAMGQHKWYVHGLCNPAKALVITNECPLCRCVFANLKSAKQHAYNAYRTGKCPDSMKAARPFLSELTVEKVDSYQCHVCKHYLEGHERIQEHLCSHFQTLLSPPQPQPTLVLAASHEPSARQAKRRGKRERKTTETAKCSRRRSGGPGHRDGRPTQEHGSDDSKRRDGSSLTINLSSPGDEHDHERPRHSEPSSSRNEELRDPTKLTIHNDAKRMYEGVRPALQEAEGQIRTYGSPQELRPDRPSGSTHSRHSGDERGEGTGTRSTQQSEQQRRRDRPYDVQRSGPRSMLLSSGTDTQEGIHKHSALSERGERQTYGSIRQAVEEDWHPPI